MQVVYYADDGTKFDNEQDCKMYEHEQESQHNNLFSGLFAETIDGVRITQINELSAAYYAYVKDKETIMLMDKLGLIREYELPEDVGIWTYDACAEKWVDLYQVRNQVADILERHVKFIRKVEEKIG